MYPPALGLALENISQELDVEHLVAKQRTQSLCPLSVKNQSPRPGAVLAAWRTTLCLVLLALLCQAGQVDPRLRHARCFFESLQIASDISNAALLQALWRMKLNCLSHSLTAFVKLGRTTADHELFQVSSSVYQKSLQVVHPWECYEHPCFHCQSHNFFLHHCASHCPNRITVSSFLASTVYV